MTAKNEGLTEAVNSTGGLWFQAEFVLVSGWANSAASFTPSWGGSYEASWDEVERAYNGDKVIRNARKVSNRWLGVRKPPKQTSDDRPLYACCHL